jgi:hypothetical protein
MSNKRIFYGLFEDEEILLKAVKNVRAEGLRIWDAFTPFPVHGLDEAMGIKPTRLHTAGFAFGATGTLTALAFMSWINVSNYPINFGGKPLLTIPSYVPITFEVTVLFASVGMVLLYFYINRLAPGWKPEILDERTTSHLFSLCFEIDESSAESQISELKRVLEANGAVEFGEKSIQAEEENILQQIF